MPAKPSALSRQGGYELIYRYFERTLIHERRYQYFGQNQNAFTFSDFRQPTHHYFANQLRNVKHFGLPQPKPGSFPITDFEFHRKGIYMDDLRFCPDCGWFYVSEGTYLFEAIKEQRKPFRAAITALIAGRTSVPEFTFSTCGAPAECAERRQQQQPQGPSHKEKVALIREQMAARRNRCVYLLQAGQAYKIGIAANVHARISAVQAACPHRLTLITTWKPKNARACEKLLHARFRRYRLQNEWFALPLDIVARLASIGTTCLARWLKTEPEDQIVAS